MGSEKSSILVRFESVGDADRRVAGVAAAARVVRDLAQRGVPSIRLACPGGGPLARATMDDLARLRGDAAVEILDEEDAPDTPDTETIRAPRPSAAAILKATGKPGDGPVSRWLNRPVSQRISRLLLTIPGIRPIHATAGTAILAILMFAALVAGGPAGLIAGGLLFHAASVFDGVDGEIARATFRSSAAGATIDTVVDIATNLLFILGVTIGLAARVGPQAYLVGGWGLLLFLIGLAALALGARADRPFSLESLKDLHRFPGRIFPNVMAAATIVSSRDFFALLFALLILAGTSMAVLYIFAGAATVWIVFVLFALAVPRRTPSAQRSA